MFSSKLLFVLCLLAASVAAINLRGDPKEAKKDGGNKTEAKKPDGPCGEVEALTKEIEKMKATDKDFMPKTFELKDKVTACRAEEAKAAQKKADSKYEKRDLGNAAEMHKDHDVDNKKGMLDGKAAAKTAKKVEKHEDAINKAGFDTAGGDKK